MDNPLSQLLAFIQAITRSWATTARTIILLTALVWLPTFTLAIIASHSQQTTAVTAALTGASLTTGRYLHKRHHTRTPPTDRSPRR